MARALSVYQVLSGKKSTVEFDGKWRRCFGDPELTGSWLIWGQSFNGKTSFTLQLCKYLCGFGKVLYNSLEEGASRSMQMALERAGMEEVARNFILLESEPMDDFRLRLALKKSPKIVVIDSVQYADLRYREYKDLKRLFPGKLFIFISHAEGKLPEGRLANKIRYDAMCKIRVEGYRAFINSRYTENSGDNYITVWDEGARKYWGNNDDNNTNSDEYDDNDDE